VVGLYKIITDKRARRLKTKPSKRLQSTFFKIFKKVFFILKQNI
jgi:hypothetical protein